LLPDVELLPEILVSELTLPLVEPAGVCNVPLAPAEPDGLVWIEPEVPLFVELEGVVLTDPLLTEPELLVASVPAPPR